jgi:hypothetical protein
VPRITEEQPYNGVLERVTRLGLPGPALAKQAKRSNR